MCRPSITSCLAAALLAIVIWPRAAHAQANLTWDVNGVAAGTGGAGTWDTSSPVWSNGGTFRAWNNSTFDNGVFGGTVGTVTVGTSVNVHNLTFSASGYIVAGGTVTLGGTTPTIRTNAGVTSTISSAIGGSAGLTKAGPGTLNVTGTNTYSGTTTISGGTLQVGNGGTSGTLGTGAVVNNATLAIDRGDAVTLANAISGTGRLTQLGAGTTTLTGTNTYRGTTTISAGTLQVGDGGTSGTLGTGNVTNSGALVLNRADALSYAGRISGAGTLTQAGAGTTTLTGTNTYTGTTTISAGTLQVGDGGTRGTLGTGAVVNHATLAIDRSNALTVANAISGTGRLTQLGAGTTTLTGANTYTGGTTISAGTLRIGAGGTVGSLAGDVTNNGLLTFNRSDALTFDGSISGTGAVTKLAAGTTTLTGTNTYTGGTTISAGTLQIGDGGTSGSLAGDSSNNGVLAFNRSDALTFRGVVSGSGALHQVGRGTTVLTGNNTYTGGTTISAGTLQIGDGGTTGALGSGPLVNNGRLAFNRSDAVVFGDAISGTGALSQLGTGTLVLTGTNTYTGGTTISAGTLQVGNGGTGGTLGSGAIVDNATLALNRSDTLMLTNDISGRGTLHQVGRGTAILTGTNTYTGGTTISAGTLQVGDGGASGGLGVGNIVNNGALAFNRTDSGLIVAGDVTGAGSVTQIGTGLTTLTGTNTYAGGTTIRAGTLQIGSGGTTGSLTGNVANDGVLAFNRSNDLDFWGVISGSGGLTKRGTGTLTLSSGHTYRGATSVEAGTMVVNGTLGKTTVGVESGARLGGAGRIGGSVAVASGARLAPGWSAGMSSRGVQRPQRYALMTFGRTLSAEQKATPAFAPGGGFGALTIEGDLRLESGSIYDVSIDAEGHNSLVMVSGKVATGGAIVAFDAQPGRYDRVTRYAVLHADGGLSGTAAAASPVATLEPWLTQTSTTLFLTLLRTDLPLAAYAASANGAAIGRAFDRLRPGAAGDLTRVTRELTALDDRALATALDAASGEVHASSLQLAELDGESSMDLVRTHIGEFAFRLEDRHTGPGRFQRRNRHHLWAQLHSQRATFDETPSAHAARTALHGFALGADRTFGGRWFMGIGGAYATGTMSLDEIAASSGFTAPRAFGYAGCIKRRWMAHVGTTVARTTYDSRRALRFVALTPTGDKPLFGGVDRQATSAHPGLATDVWGEARLNGAVGSWAFSPSVGLRVARYGRRAWAESGADALSLSAPDQSLLSKQVDTGLFLHRATGRVRPLASATYRRGLSHRQTVATLGLSDLSDGTFVVEGLPLTRDAVVGRAGSTFLTRKSALSLIYEVRRGHHHTRHALQLSVGFE